MQAIKRFFLLGLILILFGAFYYAGLGEYLSFSSLNRYHDQFQLWTQAHYFRATLVFILIYIVAVAISVPGAFLLTLTGGFLFGVLWGTVLVVVSATMGATLLFFAVKLALGDWVANRAANWVERMRLGFQKNAFSYLLVLRLIPLFPFWVVNIVPALLGVRTKTYIVATFLGIIPGSFVYVMLGNGLSHFFAQGKQPHFDIMFSPPILFPLIGLALLSLLPILYQRYKGKR